MPGANHEFFSEFPVNDSDWDEGQWKSLLIALVEKGMFSWREASSLALGHLNPSQVGTSIASNKNFQAHFPPRKTWENVRSWHFIQRGRCADCGTRLELQADHLIPKEIVSAVAGLVISDLHDGHIRNLDDLHGASLKRLEQELDKYADFLRERLKNDGPLPEFPNHLKARIANGVANLVNEQKIERKVIEGVADQLENMVLRCRRCNVIRRPSHGNGGVAFLTTEAALMWILFVKRPATYQSFMQLCRDYGMTMANIRFEEAWAMAKWLNQEGLYHIDNSCKYF
ncbi:5-methylcytosine-specific restriction endonuclease McrA [Metapseudomonas resinovorans]|uniref:hypothetical protein n=1 Tax=Metapseudomonas resinovorans TaxID=53412 RepID=UPI003D1ACBCF